MNAESKLVRQRLSVLQRAEALGNVAAGAFRVPSFTNTNAGFRPTASKG